MNWRSLQVRLGTVGELLGFLWSQKLWWMIPMVLVLLLFAGLILFGSSTALGPLIYSLF